MDRTTLRFGVNAMSKFIPNSFQIPNAFVDEVMFALSGNAVKAYLLVFFLIFTDKLIPQIGA